MKDTFNVSNEVDENGNPAGGYAKGVGMEINWQNGPLGRGDGRKSPNGAFVETVLAAVTQRIEFYQTAQNKRFACRENAIAITKIEEALMWLDSRTKAREARLVEGTHMA